MPMGGGRKKENHKIIIYRNTTHFLPHLTSPHPHRQQKMAGPKDREDRR